MPAPVLLVVGTPPGFYGHQSEDIPMDTITIEAEVGRDHRLVDALPPEVPVGRVKLVIEPLQPQAVATSLSVGSPATSHTNPAREAVRAKMLAAGILSTAHRAPEGTQEMTPEERDRVWKLFSLGRPSAELLAKHTAEYSPPPFLTPPPP